MQNNENKKNYLEDFIKICSAETLQQIANLASYKIIRSYAYFYSSLENINQKKMKELNDQIRINTYILETINDFLSKTK